MSVTESEEYINHLDTISKKRWVLLWVLAELKIKEMCLVAMSNDVWAWNLFLSD